MLTPNRERRLLDLCARLIRIPSYSSQEADIVAFLETQFRETGFHHIDRDAYGSIVGCIKGGRKGKRLLFDAHVDTVPVTDPAIWSHDPFGGKIVEARLYGRGG